MMSDTASISSVTVSPIGVIHSPYQEKFAVPRQPGLVNAINAQLELLPPYNDPHCVRGLEAFSHLWLMFLFHQNGTAEWHPTVRPPRLGVISGWAYSLPVVPSGQIRLACRLWN